MAAVPAIPNDDAIENPTVLQLVQIPEPAPNTELNMPAPTFFEFVFIIMI